MSADLDKLQFIISVDSELPRAEFAERLLKTVPGMTRKSPSFLEIEGNLIDFYDDPETPASRGHRFDLQASPVGPGIDEEHQLRLARRLVAAVASLGAHGVVGAAFEDRV